MDMRPVRVFFFELIISYYSFYYYYFFLNGHFTDNQSRTTLGALVHLFSFLTNIKLLKLLVMNT